MRTYNLFISHSWAYSNSYGNLINLMRERPYFRFKDYSVPRNDPIHTNGTDKQLYQAILRQLQPCSVILIMAGVYASYSKWIKKEIKIAKEEFFPGKPIVAIRPRGNERISTFVQNNADQIVGWNTKSVVSAIRALA